MSLIIRNELNSEERAVEELVRDSFWNVYRPGCLEHYVLHVMRSSPGFYKELNFVMYLDDVLIGQVVFHKAELILKYGSTKEIATFGPIAIHNDYKRKKYGMILLAFALNKAKFGFIYPQSKLRYFNKCLSFLFCGKMHKVLNSTKYLNYLKDHLWAGLRI